MPNESPDLIPTAEAAVLLGVSVWTLHRWVEAGRLSEAAKLPGIRGARLFNRADVEALCAAAKSA